jgi:HK97 family phage major capsid protein
VALVYATDELLADAAALEAYLQRIYPEELMFKAEDSIINGTGAGMPLGILASGATFSVPIEAGQDPATVVAENLVKMWAARDNSYNDYVWLLNQEVEAQLMLLGLAVGVGGVPVYLPPGGFSAAPFGTIFGRPVLPVEYCAALGTVGDIMLVAPSAYYMIRKGGVESASSIHVQFIYDETVFRFVMRLDGQPSINTPLTPYKGTAASISPFVTLATRA